LACGQFHVTWQKIRVPIFIKFGKSILWALAGSLDCRHPSNDWSEAMDPLGATDRKFSFYGARSQSSSFIKEKHNMRGSVFNSSPVLMEGILQKRSSGIMKQWKSRYFELTGHYLKYYDKKEGKSDSTLRGMVDLAEVKGSRSSGIKILLTMNTGVEVELKATSTDDANNWLQEIQAVCKTSPQAEGAAPAGMFTVQLPPDARPGQKIRAVVPAGLPAAGSAFEVEIPHGLRGGQLMPMAAPPVSFALKLEIDSIPGRIFHTVVPNAVLGAGRPIGVTVPLNYAGQSIVVQVPRELWPLPEFPANIPKGLMPGQLITVTIPPGFVNSGLQITVPIPNAGYNSQHGGVIMVSVPLPEEGTQLSNRSVTELGNGLGGTTQLGKEIPRGQVDDSQPVRSAQRSNLAQSNLAQSNLGGSSVGREANLGDMDIGSALGSALSPAALSTDYFGVRSPSGINSNGVPTSSVPMPSTSMGDGVPALPGTSQLGLTVTAGAVVAAGSSSDDDDEERFMLRGTEGYMEQVPDDMPRMTEGYDAANGAKNASEIRSRNNTAELQKLEQGAEKALFTTERTIEVDSAPDPNGSSYDTKNIRRQQLQEEHERQRSSLSELSEQDMLAAVGNGVSSSARPSRPSRADRKEARLKARESDGSVGMEDTVDGRNNTVDMQVLNSTVELAAQFEEAAAAEQKDPTNQRNYSNEADEGVQGFSAGDGVDLSGDGNIDHVLVTKEEALFLKQMKEKGMGSSVTTPGGQSAMFATTAQGQAQSQSAMYSTSAEGGNLQQEVDAAKAKESPLYTTAKEQQKSRRSAKERKQRSTNSFEGQHLLPVDMGGGASALQQDTDSTADFSTLPANGPSFSFDKSANDGLYPGSKGLEGGDENNPHRPTCTNCSLVFYSASGLKTLCIDCRGARAGEELYDERSSTLEFEPADKPQYRTNTLQKEIEDQLAAEIAGLQQQEGQTMQNRNRGGSVGGNNVVTSPIAEKVEAAATHDPHQPNCDSCQRVFYSASGRSTLCMDCRGPRNLTVHMPLAQVQAMAQQHQQLHQQQQADALSPTSDPNGGNKNHHPFCGTCGSKFYSASGSSTLCMDCRRMGHTAGNASPGTINAAPKDIREAYERALQESASQVQAAASQPSQPESEASDPMMSEIDALYSSGKITKEKAEELRQRVEDMGDDTRNVVCVSGEDRADVAMIKAAFAKNAPDMRVVDMSLGASELLNPAPKFASVSRPSYCSLFLHPRPIVVAAVPVFGHALDAASSVTLPDSSLSFVSSTTLRWH
jgi:hypothetical protein